MVVIVVALFVGFFLLAKMIEAGFESLESQLSSATESISNTCRSRGPALAPAPAEPPAPEDEPEEAGEGDEAALEGDEGDEEGTAEEGEEEEPAAEEYPALLLRLVVPP